MFLIHPEILDLPGEKGEFFEGAFEFGFFGVGFDVDVEATDLQGAGHGVAFELEEVDTVGGEASEGFVEGGGEVANVEEEGGDVFFVWMVRRDGIFPGEDDKAGDIALHVTKILLEDLEVIEVGGELGRDGTPGGIYLETDLLGGASSIEASYGGKVEVDDVAAALGECLRVGGDVTDGLQSAPFDPEEAVVAGSKCSSMIKSDDSGIRR